MASKYLFPWAGLCLMRSFYLSRLSDLYHESFSLSWTAVDAGIMRSIRCNIVTEVFKFFCWDRPFWHLDEEILSESRSILLEFQLKEFITDMDCVGICIFGTLSGSEIFLRRWMMLARLFIDIYSAGIYNVRPSCCGRFCWHENHDVLYLIWLLPSNKAWNLLIEMDIVIFGIDRSFHWYWVLLA